MADFVEGGSLMELVTDFSDEVEGMGWSGNDALGIGVRTEAMGVAVEATMFCTCILHFTSSTGVKTKLAADPASAADMVSCPNAKVGGLSVGSSRVAGGK